MFTPQVGTYVITHVQTTAGRITSFSQLGKAAGFDTKMIFVNTAEGELPLGAGLIAEAKEAGKLCATLDRQGVIIKGIISKRGFTGMQIEVTQVG